mmetsp:Transcript_4670/g.7218  ORF Transcript_4670/g.7218 Transcript_4670/m.7218 type:complete len:406 (+) Transcript_4670:214-1431(+)
MPINTQRVGNSLSSTPIFVLHAHKIVVFCSGAIFICLFAVNLHLVVNLEKQSIGTSESWQMQNFAIQNSNNEIQVDADRHDNSNNTSTNEVIDYFRRAGVELDNESIERLPTWSQIESLIGKKPVFRGLDTCETFRNNVPPLSRMLGSAGMFNSGTNLVTRLMKENCVIPERFNKYSPDPKASKEDYGIRWQCPWGKHTPANFKNNHTAPKNEETIKDHCLPIVTVRNPFDWMISMCHIPYTARWPHNKFCPHLVTTYSNGEKVPVGVKVKLAEQWLNFDSLADLWNEFYAQYYRDFEYPYLIVRFEDLTFRQYETTKTICECAGGVVKPQDMFKYIIKSAKQGPGHGKVSDRTGMVDAWIKYGQPKQVKGGFSDEDYDAAIEFLSHEFMESMGYKYPPPAPITV